MRSYRMGGSFAEVQGHLSQGWRRALPEAQIREAPSRAGGLGQGTG